jgi:hypothetical protein
LLQQLQPLVVDLRRAAERHYRVRQSRPLEMLQKKPLYNLFYYTKY